MEVRENSYSYELWEKTPIPMYMSVYYFNITNAEEIMDETSLLNETSHYTKPL